MLFDYWLYLLCSEGYQMFYFVICMHFGLRDNIYVHGALLHFANRIKYGTRMWTNTDTF